MCSVHLFLSYHLIYLPCHICLCRPHVYWVDALCDLMIFYSVGWTFGWSWLTFALTRVKLLTPWYLYQMVSKNMLRAHEGKHLLRFLWIKISFNDPCVKNYLDRNIVHRVQYFYFRKQRQTHGDIASGKLHKTLWGRLGGGGKSRNPFPFKI